MVFTNVHELENYSLVTCHDAENAQMCHKSLTSRLLCLILLFFSVGTWWPASLPDALLFSTLISTSGTTSSRTDTTNRVFLYQRAWRENNNNHEQQRAWRENNNNHKQQRAWRENNNNHEQQRAWRENNNNHEQQRALYMHPFSIVIPANYDTKRENITRGLFTPSKKRACLQKRNRFVWLLHLGQYAHSHWGNNVHRTSAMTFTISPFVNANALALGEHTLNLMSI